MPTVGGNITVGSGGGGGGASDHGDLTGLDGDDHTQYSRADGTRGTANLGDTTGTLPVASGGTGATTASGARTALGALGTNDQAANSLLLNGFAGNYYRDPSNLSAAVAIDKGGTGQTTTAGARVALGVDIGGVHGGRLCMSATDPLDGSAGSSLYYTAYSGEYVAAFSGSSLTLAQITSSTTFDLSTDNDLDSASIASSSVYDVFVTISGSEARLALKKWTNATTRATSLSRTGGVYYIQISSSYYRYVGTIRTSSTTQVTSEVGRRYIWNAYNRVSYVDEQRLASTTYAIGASVGPQLLNAAGAGPYDEYQHRFVCGLASSVRADMGMQTGTISGGVYDLWIGLDGTTQAGAKKQLAAGGIVHVTGAASGVIGYRSLAAVEETSAGTSATVTIGAYTGFIAQGEW